jgi:hypothetical protein
MLVKEKNTMIMLQPESRLGEALKKMLEHKRLKEQFWRGEITLLELNQLLTKKGIHKQYEHETAV